MHLWFGDILVAELWDVIPHQGTWFGSYKQVVVREEGTLQSRLHDYIRFSEDWHRRLQFGEKAEAEEFDQFADLTTSTFWRVLCPDGSNLAMNEGPIFVEGTASWNHPEEGPSREVAAEQVWARLTKGAERLARLLSKSDPRHESICGEECRSLIQEAKRNLPQAIEHRENEIRLIRRLHELMA